MVNSQQRILTQGAGERVSEQDALAKAVISLSVVKSHPRSQGLSNFCPLQRKAERAWKQGCLDTAQQT